MDTFDPAWKKCIGHPSKHMFSLVEKKKKLEDEELEDEELGDEELEEELEATEEG